MSNTLTKTKKRRASKATLTRARIVSDKREFLKLYEQSMSVVAASTKLGIHRATFYKWCNADKVFQKKFIKLRGHKVQYVRDQLEALVTMGDLRAIIFFLQHNAPEYANNLKLLPGGEWAEESKERRKLTTDQRKMIKVALKNIYDNGNDNSAKTIRRITASN